jgi:hypothetical protein
VRFRYDAQATRGRWRTARQVLSERGWLYLLRIVGLWATSPVWRPVVRRLGRTFELAPERHAYFLHNYNLTWSNERAVEIPIVWSEVCRRRGGRVLEVGNVLSHYFDVRHQVLDKFERGGSILNEDAVSFRADRPYDLIVSISTLEHIGWDEDPRDPGKIARTVANLSAQLAPGGCLVATLPLGYNADMDRQLAAGSLPFSRCRYLRRSGLTTWSEVAWEQVAGATYGDRWPGTRGLVIGYVER